MVSGLKLTTNEITLWGHQGAGDEAGDMGGVRRVLVCMGVGRGWGWGGCWAAGWYNSLHQSLAGLTSLLGHD